jgi:hypothetical protein
VQFPVENSTARHCKALVKACKQGEILQRLEICEPSKIFSAGNRADFVFTEETIPIASYQLVCLYIDSRPLLSHTGCS